MTELTERERRIWDAAYGAAFAATREFTMTTIGNSDVSKFLGVIGLTACKVADEAVEEFRKASELPGAKGGTGNG